MHVREQNPHRLAERACQVRDCGIDGDHKLKLIDRCRSIGKVGERTIEARQVWAAFQLGPTCS